MSSPTTAALATRSRDAVRGIGQPRAEREQIALDPLEHRLQRRHPRPTRARDPASAFSSSTSPYAATRGSDLSTRVPSNRPVSPRRRSWCRFSRRRLSNKVPRPTPVTACPHERSRPRGARRRTSGPLCPRHAARQRFRRRLLDWYRRNGRDSALAARRSDPYHILVSEVMLQQTQVDRVLPKYHEWLAKYPTLDGARRRAESRRLRDVAAARLQHPAAAAARDRARVGCQATAARCRRTKRRCCRSRASANTPPARSSASRSASARRSSTPTSRACCFACSSAPAIRRRTR